MSDNNTPNAPDATGNPAPAQDTAADAQNMTQLPQWAQDLVHGLRKEAAGYRTEKQKAREEAENKERQRLADEQKWQELATTLQAQLDALKPKLEAADSYRATIEATVKARIEALPAQYRTLVPEYENPAQTLQWLDANAATLKAPAVPVLDAGRTGDTSNKTVRLTPEELEFARRMQISPEKYAARKAEIASNTAD